MNKITALIITLNEEKHIAACVDALRSVADEILVLDSESADGTRQIAAAHGARVITEKFQGFGWQKNRGADLASFDLILSIDADEIISAELRASILEVKQNNRSDAYAVNRRNYIGDRAIYNCGWYPDARVRLYDRRKAKWDDRSVHENLIVSGSTQHLAGDLLHYSYQNVDEVKAKSDYYGRLGAAVYRGKNPFLLFCKMIFSPIFKFMKIYFLKRGFTDGYVGLMISYYRSRETFLKYYLAWK